MKTLHLLWIVLYSLLFYLYVFNNPITIPLILIIAFFLGFLTNLIIVSITAPFTLLFDKKNKIKKAYIKNILKYAASLLGMKYKVVNPENLQKENYVLVSNHKSYCDIILLYIIAKSPIGFVAKPGVFKVPILSIYMKAIGCISMHRDDDREGAKDMIRAIKQVKEGLPMCIFPEGGIKDRDDEKMVAIRSGAYKLATKPQAKIVPVSIKGMSKLRKNFPFKRTKIEVIVHKPIESSEYATLNTHEIGDKVFEIVNNVFEN